jgi:peptidylamidoglycolate lyase
MRGSVLLRVALPGALLAGCASERIEPVPSQPSYTVVHGWPQIPEGALLGQVSGVAIEANGDVLLFRRADHDWFGGPVPVYPIAAPTILRYDPLSGSLLTSMAAATFSMPHGISVDGAGHLWVTDVSLHQVLELDASGAVMRTLGERGVPGDDAGHFNMPTDVAVATDGTFYVSDGYGNARVAKFAADGTFIKDWGQHGAGNGEFNIPHSIAIGPDGNIYVADRGNFRVQIFDTEGNWLASWQDHDKLGRPWAITFDKAGHVFIADGGDQPIAPPDRARILELEPSRNVGASSPIPAVITTFGSYGNQDGQMIEPHDIAVGDDGAVYVVEVGIGKRAQKFVPTLVASPAQ